MSRWVNPVPGMKGLSMEREGEEKKNAQEKEGEVEGVELRKERIK